MSVPAIHFSAPPTLRELFSAMRVEVAGLREVNAALRAENADLRARLTAAQEIVADLTSDAGR